MIAVLAALSERCDLTALFCSGSATRAMDWTFPELAFRHRIVGGLTLRRRSPDATDFYPSPRILAALYRSRPEVIISGGFSFPSLYAAAHARLTGSALVIHSDGTARSEAGVGRGQRLTRRVLAQASHVAAGNSQQAVARFVELGWPQERALCVPHATTLDPLHAVARSRTHRTGEQLSVLSVGRLIPRKGVDRLIAAAGLARAQGADVRLAIVGVGPEEQALRDQARRLAVPVGWHGFVDQDGLPSLYAAADAFAFPTLDDPFGIVLLEAAAAGLPLIASPHGGATGDLIREDEAGFVVDPDDIEAYAYALVTLARDPKLRERMGRAAHEETLARTPEAAAEAYLRAAELARQQVRRTRSGCVDDLRQDFPSPRVAYLTGRYPAISHTFILREVRALRELGVEVATFSIWKTASAELLSPPDREEARSTAVLLPLRPLRLTAALAALVRAPHALRPLLREAAGLGRAGLRGKLLVASWLVEATLLSHACRRAGIRHIHAHLGGSAPAVALLAATLGNAIDGTGEWTWSFTVHGPTELYDVVRERLAVKVRRATFVIAISDFARSQLLALVDEEAWEKVHVVHCGVDPAAFAPSPEALAGNGGMRILSIGRLVRMKGQAVLLEALRLLRERGVAVHATIVGDGPKRVAYERIAHEQGLNDAVTFTGSIGQEEVRAQIANADVFCSSSFAEGVPVVLMEAMAMGRPVVAPRIMGIPELVEDGVNGRLVAPARSDLLADALQQLADDAALRRRMGEAGRRKVIEQFDVTREAVRLRDLFQRYMAVR